MAIMIKDVIAKLLEPPQSPAPIPRSVDTLKFGDPNTIVKGIVVTFIATVQVIEQAIKLGANLIITHEGSFYSHHDDFETSLREDPIYQAKKSLIEENRLAIYRFHDVVHRYAPDGITEGLVHALDWQAYVTEQLAAVTLLTLPAPLTVTQVAEHARKQLGIDYVRTVGPLSTVCRRIGLLVGYRGGGPLLIPLFEQHNLDLILYGEGPEWESPEYVRDAAYIGKNKALVVLGHAESEQPGMKLIAERLQRQLPGTPVYFIPVDAVYQLTSFH